MINGAISLKIRTIDSNEYNVNISKESKIEELKTRIHEVKFLLI
jgi:hypothetical protein